MRTTFLLELLSQSFGDFLLVFCWVVGESVNNFIADGFPLGEVMGASSALFGWGIHFCLFIISNFLTTMVYSSGLFYFFGLMLLFLRVICNCLGLWKCLGPADRFGYFQFFGCTVYNCISLLLYIYIGLVIFSNIGSTIASPPVTFFQI